MMPSAITATNTNSATEKERIKFLMLSFGVNHTPGLLRQAGFDNIVL